RPARSITLVDEFERKGGRGGVRPVAYQPPQASACLADSSFSRGDRDSAPGLRCAPPGALFPNSASITALFWNPLGVAGIEPRGEGSAARGQTRNYGALGPGRRTTRKPTRTPAGAWSPRTAERQPLGSLPQEPPRRTRLFPFSGPIGSSIGFFWSF